MLIPNPDLPIAVATKTDRDTTSFLDGYEQHSGFAPLKSVSLNYLDRSDLELDSLLNYLDSAGGKPDFTWDFRPHYSNKKWRVKSFNQVQYDRGVVEEWTIELEEYPTAPATVGVGEITLPNYLVPVQAPTLSTEYRFRESKLGKFPDYGSHPIHGKRQKLSFSSLLTWAQADEIDILLDRARGVFPLIYSLYEGNWVCPEWSITYEGNDCAEIKLELANFFTPGAQ